MTCTLRLFLKFSLTISLSSAIISIDQHAFDVDIKPFFDDFDAWKSERDEFIRYSSDYPFGWDQFHCDVPETIKEPSDIHHVAPWHISVIGAMGDSLTAGRATGANLLGEIPRDYRGLSFAIGEDYELYEYATLPNIFRQFSPSLTGSSHNISNDKNVLLSHFNVARSGAKAHDLLRQAQELVKRMKLELSFGFFTKWKFVNIFIGSNDLCDLCQNETLYGAEAFESSVRETLSYLKENMPRTYIQIMPPFNVSVLQSTHESHPFCIDIHKITCPSIFGYPSEKLQSVKEKMDNFIFELNTEDYEAPDFTVVVAPIISKISLLPIVGSSINIAFTALDCFHFSPIAHDMVAKTLWNNLFEPVYTREIWKTFGSFNPVTWKCPPKECPYLRTKKNSLICLEDISIPNMKLRVQPVEVPSQSELEMRLSEDSVIVKFSAYFIGLMIVVVLIALSVNGLQKRLNKKNKRKADEGTPLLLTANLYDDFLI
ncbi:unnamed protein product [Auanema sp. JU1783]|nr:unnamed protein product [Auanema sp. JU1783]